MPAEVLTANQLSKVSYKDGDRPWEDFTLRGSLGPVLTICVVLQDEQLGNGSRHEQT